MLQRLHPQPTSAAEVQLGAMLDQHPWAVVTMATKASSLLLWALLLMVVTGDAAPAYNGREY